jgi:cytochrome c6
VKPSKGLVVERVTNGRNAMPSFKGKLTDAQIQAVADYVSSVAGK